MYKHLSSFIGTSELFPKKKIAARCWRPHGGKLTDVVKHKKIKLIQLMGVRQPHWHKRSIFSQSLFWLLLLQTPFAHMTGRSSRIPEDRIKPHDGQNNSACQFTYKIQDKEAYRADWDVYICHGRFKLHLKAFGHSEWKHKSEGLTDVKTLLFIMLWDYITHITK